MKNTQGFTLLELLIVMAMLGIVFALSAGALSGGRDRREMREAQKTFEQATERVRTLVRRYGYNYLLTIATNKKSFVYSARDAAGLAVANSAPDVTGQLPDSVTISVRPLGLNLANPLFKAPFARTLGGGSPICFELVSSISSLKNAVDLVGVTGKVVSRDISNTSGCTI
jgi:prepilin-type N-terminal cleavage/methylation domain-containing protein